MADAFFICANGQMILHVSFFYETNPALALFIIIFEIRPVNLIN